MIERLPLFARLFILFLAHPVAHPDFRKYVLGFSGIFLQLPSDMGHVYPQNLVVAVCKWAPYFGNNTFIGHDLAGVLGQQGNQFIFNLG